MARLIDEMLTQWVDRADGPDGGLYAIAAAIMSLAGSLDRLGNADAATPMGAIEALGAHLGGKIEDLANAIRSLRDD